MLCLPGGSASLQQSDVPKEKIAFSVTRHTPRRHPARRTLSDSGDSPMNADKKRRLDSERVSDPTVTREQGKNTRTGKNFKLSSQTSIYIITSKTKKEREGQFLSISIVSTVCACTL